MTFLIVILLAVVLMAIAFAGFAVTILLKKGGNFPNTHVSGNQYLRSQGISCFQSYDRMEQAKVKQKINFSSLKISQ